ncbi:hypothetical protein A2291_07915 [candidate division WOR-1 bacterium RIFOXYB2_FULL_42_35]|uniref:HEPN domain-containing protein n=1 Tax=candidate division WOR-1 bacterium RIFOXYC2_FULL_41_25 TaxID=1802586 RepID=A0A1F4TJH8_UNCSA|nr:MAG: hypothetical protein A2247_08440 [candidate division WOR-1 bacterium RIFOXYA2_FULL_41_14]OGC21893.1 MAG: hypothetical protein A2291_07915 [candidate division WOR-1 bacterium RIFOXYB2_FULL_42_35]OGC32757.1 MAG: hypothetical protein A2462_03890 [candidate division WOR-1 bacterium RIFOXYC2_FULL_41_25]OGC42553.1 MAG: hypothetical protein A2548_01145 [candidate division WOR-1 bacterium RIFOXYD2_FULL_41_8]
MINKSSTVNAEKSAYSSFFRKSGDFFKSAKSNLETGNWNAAGLDAVHAAISANDALLVYSHGIRSSSKSHDDAVKLTASLISKEGVKEALNHLRRIIAKKNLIEYEGKCFFRSDAESIVLHADRFLSWVKGILP